MRDYDESDARVRPSRRGSRPRTKIRPQHDEAIFGFIVGVDRGRYTVNLGEREVTAVKARELGRRGIVMGDRVGLVGDTSGEDGSLARIVKVTERYGVLRRTADDTDPTERIVVANADQLAIVTALADPEPNERMIDRCLVAGFDAGLETVIVFTKADLASSTELRRIYEPLGVKILETQKTGGDIDGITEVAETLSNKVTVLVGYSGVGKSTLVNALVPDADRATGEVNSVTGRGRHTSTNARALALPDGGWIIDTPGVRSLGLAHVDTEHFIHAFSDIAEAAEACPRGCQHLSAADGCELDNWAGTPERTSRLDSLRRLLLSRQKSDKN